MAEVFKMGDGDWLTTEGGLVCTSTKTLDGSIEGILMEGERSSPKITQGADRVYYESKVDEPAISYENSANGALLLEPSTTNYITYSEDFTQWSDYGNATIEQSNEISPMGTQGVGLAKGATGDDFFLSVVQNSVSVDSSTEYVGSAWVKSAGATTVKVRLKDNTTGGSSSVTTSLTNDWQRVSTTPLITGSSTGTTTLFFSETDGDILVYGAQVEEGSVATSYIPTNGQTEVRAADSQFKTIDISKYINSSEGCIKIGFKRNFGDTETRRLRLSDKTSSNFIDIRFQSPGNRIELIVQSSNSFLGTSSVENLSLDDFYNIVVKWDSNGFIMKVNNVEGNQISSQVLFSNNIKELRFRNPDLAQYLYGEVEYFKIYDSVDDY